MAKPKIPRWMKRNGEAIFEDQDGPKEVIIISNPRDPFDLQRQLLNVQFKHTPEMEQKVRRIQLRPPARAVTVIPQAA